MIAQFPEPYPDELLYSVLARYYVRAGYISVSHCLEDIYEMPVRPDIEYLNCLKTDVIKELGGIDTIILQHTMFPALRFHPFEKKVKAYEFLKTCDVRYQNYVCKPNGIRYLRYCPCCATEERKKNGEAYWHRVHQLVGIDACPFHGIKLKTSAILIYSKEAKSLHPAEINIPFSDVYEKASAEETELSIFVKDVFEMPGVMNSNRIGGWLRSKTPLQYRSTSQKRIQGQILFQDFKDIYPRSSITKKWQIRMIFNDVRSDFVEICQLASFFGIAPEVLTADNKAPEKSISKQNNRKYRSHEKNWSEHDEKCLLVVQNTIQKLQHADKPVQITITTVARMAGIPHSTLERRLPKCVTYIKEHSETKEEFWKRKLEWAYQVIKTQHLPLHRTQLRRLTNIEYKNMKRVVTILDNEEILNTIIG